MTFLRNFLNRKSTTEHSNRWIFGTMLAAGILGLAMALSLSIERVQQLSDPSAPLICNFNIIFNCGEVMKTWQAKLFGFPNSFIGLMGFSVVITVAVAALSGVKFPKRFLQATQIGYGLGLIFAYWLFFQSVYVIQVLCPLCLVVTVATTLIFETMLRYNLRENIFDLPKHLHKKILGWLSKDYDKFAVAGWLALMIALVLIQFPGIL
ncbi:MAG TPA: vitamin K epoxide reductase family protein [Candidatus Saccharimonadales bacterium]|nr:vitamin K epoxide reductase family protein [Candidatus Saccharimonadales bacterium]